MPTKKYALERGGPQRLELNWSGMWKNFRITLDGRPIGGIDGGSSAMKAGKSFALGDGSQLEVKLVTGFANAELQVLRDGKPLPGSGSDPEERLKQSWMMIWFVAGLTTIVGLIAVVARVQFLLDAGLGLPSIAVGAFYFALGWIVRTYRSAIALAIAVGLFAIDGILSLATGFGPGHTPPVGMIVARIFFIIPMVRGFGAISALKAAGEQPLAQAVGGPRGPSKDPWQGPQA